MIEVNNVSLILNKYTILDDVSVKAGKGEAVGLIGGNGSGKTMLMKCICGFNTMFTGEITVKGCRICAGYRVYHRDSGIYSIYDRIRKS